MSFAIIKTGGKQYRVAVGDKIKVEKLSAVVSGENSNHIVFDEVLLVDNGAETKIGAPLIVGTQVLAKRLHDGRRDKVTVVKYKPKVNYRKKYGHRQPYTEVEITGIKEQ